MGVNTFADSLDNPDYYICVQDKENSFGTNTKNGEFVLIQKASHPDFGLEENEEIIFIDIKGELICSKISDISSIRTYKMYYTTNNQKPVYENQIIGKVVKIIDNNIISQISVRVWEISVNNFNINNLKS
jgi:hypothetical protein